jgi:hypothetical protein
MVVGRIRCPPGKRMLRTKGMELSYANAHKLRVDRFIEVEMSSRKDLKLGD